MVMSLLPTQPDPLLEGVDPDNGSDVTEGAADDLLQYVSDDIAARVMAGELELSPGWHHDKPVIRSKVTGRVVKGSGRYPKANDPAELGRATAFKHSNEYRAQLMETIPARASKSTRYSLELLIDRFMEAVDGQEKSMRCEHPNCTKQHSWVQPIDINGIFKLIENLVGKAEQVQQVQVSGSVDVTHRTFDIRVYDIEPDAAYERRAALVEAGILDVIEGQFVDVAGPEVREPQAAGVDDASAGEPVVAAPGQGDSPADVGEVQLPPERVGFSSRTHNWVEI